MRSPSTRSFLILAMSSASSLGFPASDSAMVSALASCSSTCVYAWLASLASFSALAIGPLSCFMRRFASAALFWRATPAFRMSAARVSTCLILRSSFRSCFFSPSRRCASRNASCRAICARPYSAISSLSTVSARRCMSAASSFLACCMSFCDLTSSRPICTAVWISPSRRDSVSACPTPPCMTCSRWARERRAARTEESCCSRKPPRGGEGPARFTCSSRRSLMASSACRRECTFENPACPRSSVASSISSPLSISAAAGCAAAAFRRTNPWARISRMARCVA
mmetsp:Transcript_42792/g.101827  ORF Transcript_42792/g.101827 Transcript_42792/m.101827 type:complete len:284 (-) Transcript_42792:483-1334(-)